MQTSFLQRLVLVATVAFALLLPASLQAQLVSAGITGYVRTADGQPFAGAEITVEQQEEGPPTGSPVSIEGAGEDFDELSRIAGDIIRRMVAKQGIIHTGVAA
jgi:hypothetical protein